MEYNKELYTLLLKEADDYMAVRGLDNERLYLQNEDNEYAILRYEMRMFAYKMIEKYIEASGSHNVDRGISDLQRGRGGRKQ